MKVTVLITILLILLLAVPVLAFLITPLRSQITKKTHLAFLLATASIIVEFAISPLRWYVGMEIASLIGFLVFLLATFYFLTKFSPRFHPYQVTIFFLLGFVLFQGLRIPDFKAGLVSFPDAIIHALGICGGYFFYNRKSIVHKLNLSVSVLIVLFTYFYGYNLWINNLDYGSFNSDVYYKGPAKITLIDKNANDVVVKKGKITVLDFWFIGCSACMDDFPEFQKIYTANKSNPDIQFLSINQPYPHDREVDRFKYLTDAGYSFPMAATRDTSLISNLQIAVYPTIIILNGDGDVIFKGNLKEASSKIKELL